MSHESMIRAAALIEAQTGRKIAVNSRTVEENRRWREEGATKRRAEAEAFLEKLRALEMGPRKEVPDIRDYVDDDRNQGSLGATRSD